MQDHPPAETKRERYRRRAQECLEAAKTAQTEKVRLALLEIAETWLCMADEQQDQ